MDENKEELFLYFVEQLTTTGTGHGEVVSSKGESVLLNNENDDTAEVAPCKHKELIRGILHAADAANFGYNKLMVHPVDSYCSHRNHGIPTRFLIGAVD